jgi:hypothetical protein
MSSCKDISLSSKAVVRGVRSFSSYTYSDTGVNCYNIRNILRLEPRLNYV